MSANFKIKRWAFWALTSIVFSLFTPFIAHYSYADALSATPIVQGKALLCTAQGLKWVDIDSYSDSESHSQSSGQHHCPFCLLTDNHSDDLGYISNSDNSLNDYSALLPLGFSTTQVQRSAARIPPSRAPPLV